MSTMPVYIPVETLEALAKFTGNWWSDEPARQRQSQCMESHLAALAWQ